MEHFTREWFEDAKESWLENKRRRKTAGAFIYTCRYTYKSGKFCGRDVKKGANCGDLFRLACSEYCRQHEALLKFNDKCAE